MLVNFNKGYYNPQFKHKPSANEMRNYTKAVSQGLKVLDKEVGITKFNTQ